LVGSLTKSTVPGTARHTELRAWSLCVRLSGADRGPAAARLDGGGNAATACAGGCSSDVLALGERRSFGEWCDAESIARVKRN